MHEAVVAFHVVSWVLGSFGSSLTSGLLFDAWLVSTEACKTHTCAGSELATVLLEALRECAMTVIDIMIFDPSLCLQAQHRRSWSSCGLTSSAL